MEFDFPEHGFKMETKRLRLVHCVYRGAITLRWLDEETGEMGPPLSRRGPKKPIGVVISNGWAKRDFGD